LPVPELYKEMPHLGVLFVSAVSKLKSLFLVVGASYVELL
jgi:hypothetical protein